MSKGMINVYGVAAIAWVVLRLGDLGDSYRRIFYSGGCYDDFVLYCGAIRNSLFAYTSHSEREPGQFLDTVDLMLSMTDQVLANAAKSRDIAADKAPWNQIIKSIDGHRKDLAEALDKSRVARKEMDARLAAAPAADNDALLSNAI